MEHGYVFALVHVLQGVWEGRINGKETKKNRKEEEERNGEAFGEISCVSFSL